MQDKVYIDVQHSLTSLEVKISEKKKKIWLLRFRGKKEEEREVKEKINKVVELKR